MSILGIYEDVATDDTYEIYDYHLSSDSPCVDAANGDVAPETDIAGNARIDVVDVEPQNSGKGPPWADMGAYEYQ